MDKEEENSASIKIESGMDLFEGWGSNGDVLKNLALLLEVHV
jgi:hypothetical protein